MDRLDDREGPDPEVAMTSAEANLDRAADAGEHHATTGGAVAAGAMTGGVIGLAGGPVGAALGAVGGAIIGAAAERMMHAEADAEPEPERAVPEDADDVGGPVL